MRTPRLLQRLLQALAALARVVAQALERVAGPPRLAGRPAALEALSERFPGAPDHWLRVIAERAPQLAEAVSREEAVPPPAPIHPPARLRLAWPGRWARTPRAPEFPSDPPRAAPMDEAWPRPDIAESSRPEFPETRREPGSPAVPHAEPLAKVPRPRLRLVPSDPSQRRPPAETPSDGARPARVRGDLPAAPPAHPRPALTLAGSTPSKAAPLAHFGEPEARRASQPAWPPLDEPVRPRSWIDSPGHTQRRPEDGPAELQGVQHTAADPSFSSEPAARGSVDRWESLARPATERPNLASPARPAAAERAAFSDSHDPRWPPLPPVDRDEAARVPAAGVGRHVREQELGGWSG